MSFFSGSDDQMHMFHLADQSQICLEPRSSAVLVLKFVPLTQKPRHCAVILKNKELGDIILSIYATVKYPTPSVPETRFLNSSTVVNSQTRTLHLKTYAGQTVEEEIIIGQNNAALENAMHEICKWDMSPLEIKQRNLSKSFKYAMLLTAIATLGMDSKPASFKYHLSQGREGITFSIEGSDNKHFTHPEEISLSVNSGGKYSDA